MYSFDEIEAAHAAIEAHVRRVLRSQTLTQLTDAVENLAREARALGDRKVPNPVAPGSSAYLDVNWMAQVLGARDRLTRLLRAGTSNKQIAEELGVPKQAASLATYYLRAFGVLQAERAGRANVYRMLTEDINPDIIKETWASIQPRNFSPEWQERTEEALMVEHDDDPVVEKLARQAMEEMLQVISSGASPIDASDAVLAKVDQTLRRQVERRLWQLKVKCLAGE